MSSAGRCIARSTSSGIVVGPGIARNSRPARTVIVLVPLAMLGEGMQGNDGIFKPEHHDNKLKPAWRANRSRECAPDDRLREAIRSFKVSLDWFVAEFSIGRPKAGPRWLLAMTSHMARRLSLGFAAARGLGLVDRTEPAGALADLHLDLRIPAATGLMIDAFAGPVDVALDGAVGRGRDRSRRRRQQDRVGVLGRFDGPENRGLLVAEVPVPRRDEGALP